MAKYVRCAFIALFAVCGCKSKGPIPNTMQGHTKLVWSSDGINVAAFLVADDFDNLVEGQQSILKMTDLPLIAHVDLVTTAQKYEADFDANEIAADQKYHLKKVLLYGTVSSINKDAMGDGYFTLSSEHLLGVQAHLNADGLMRAVIAKKGDRVALVCDPGMRIIGFATAANCSYLSQYLKRAHLSPEEQVRAFFAGEVGLRFDEVAEAMTGYAIGTSPWTPRECATNPNATSCDFSKWKLNDAERRQLTKYLDQTLTSLKQNTQFTLKHVSCSDFSHEIREMNPASPEACFMLAATATAPPKH